MSSDNKTYITSGEVPDSQIGASLDTLAQTIEQRRSAGEESYTYRLLHGELDTLLKKIGEESIETALAAKDVAVSGSDEDLNHLRYEAGDVVYHLLVLLARVGISLDEFAAEMNTRMSEDELALRTGVVMLKPEYVNRGKH